MEKSSVQFTADSVTGLQGRADCASLLPLLSSEHVEFLLFQGRRKLAAGHRRAKRSSDAEGGAFGWRHEVPPSLFSFLSVLFCALVCPNCWGCPLLKSWNHEWIIAKIFRQSSYENRSSGSDWSSPRELCAWWCVYFRVDECLQTELLRILFMETL